MDNAGNYDDRDYIQDGRRKRLSQEDSEMLMEAFARNPRPTPDERNELARQLGLNSRSIQIWFQNRRAKLKKEAHDPDLFSTKPSAPVESFNFPVVNARNFKEMCLPKYLDIPIKGQQFTTEDISKNDAIRMFWRRHQEHSIKEPEIQMEASVKESAIKENKQQTLLTPPTFASKGLNKRPKTLLETDQKGYNMPDLLPFTEISGNRAGLGSKMDYLDLSFLNQSVKQINDQDTLRTELFKPQLDSMATDLQFLFDSSMPVSIKHNNEAQQQQQFSEFFSVLSDMSVRL